jgi:hypothetical protein
MSTYVVAPPEGSIATFGPAFVDRSAQPCSPAVAAGSVKWKVAPPPSRWDAQSFPPWASMSLRQIARPTPSPWDLVD